MPKLTEYLKLIPKAIPHTKEIVESIVNDVHMRMKTLSEDKKEEIIRRRIICATCPFMSKNATTSKEYLALTGYHYHTNRKDEHCSFCGCELKMRTRSLSSNCGIESWNKDNPTRQIPLKWTKYEQG